LPENISSSSSDEDASASDRGKKEPNEEEVPKVVIFSGAGEKAFCAGGDVASLCIAKKKNNQSDKQIKDFFR
jgi:hypothetical protein